MELCYSKRFQECSKQSENDNRMLTDSKRSIILLHIWYMCQILDCKIEMTESAFRTLINAVQTDTLRHDIYINDRYHRLCFSTAKWIEEKVKQALALLKSKDFGHHGTE